MRIAIIGGGPAGLFVYKQLIENAGPDLEICVYESGERLGAGMPYSRAGAEAEHIANVSANELPPLVTTMKDWIQDQPEGILEKFSIVKKEFNELRVLPRLLLGQYLEAQFGLLLKIARAKGIHTSVYYNSPVHDVQPNLPNNTVGVIGNGVVQEIFDRVVICIGHCWPKIHEGKVAGYYDSPYPPAKLELLFNHPVAIRGSSLTAIDAIRTLARQHGHFITDENNKLHYVPNNGTGSFCMIMHSIHGLLPALRIHSDEPGPARVGTLAEEEIAANRASNEGFLSLDFLFEKGFKEPLREKDPLLYEKIAPLSMEAFVDWVMNFREKMEPFTLLQAELKESKQSIRRHEAIPWKELLADLSFAMNYPAKYLSAEDMLRLKKVLMPLISIVIAFVPQSSAEELLALHAAGKLELVSIDTDSKVEPCPEGGIIYSYKDAQNETVKKRYQTYINCVGQPALSFEQFPFSSLKDEGVVSAAYLKFRDSHAAMQVKEEGIETIREQTGSDFYLKVPGVTINDHFQAVDTYGRASELVYVMAVPYISGYNPDYSGLDFCEEASRRIAVAIMSNPSG